MFKLKAAFLSLGLVAAVGSKGFGAVANTHEDAAAAYASVLTDEYVLGSGKTYKNRARLPSLSHAVVARDFWVFDESKSLSRHACSGP
jgi:hypothetical protein